MAYALGLPDALRRRGLTVEVVPGWETRSAGSFNPKGAVCHWTAGPKNAADKARPSLRICTEGRTGLPGPLCNVYLDRAGIAVVVAAGRANHAGVGGWKGLVGNSSVFGTEAESGGDGDWTKAQRKSYPLINAAYCDLGGFGADMVCGHNEWAAGRKIDIRDWPMPLMRLQVGAVLSGAPSPAAPTPVEDDEMKPKLYRVKDTVTVYLAVPGRFFGVDPNFLGTLVVAGLLPADWTKEVRDLPSQAHLDFMRYYFERVLSPAGELAALDADLDELLSRVPDVPAP